jgi:hypothetical protein
MSDGWLAVILTLGVAAFVGTVVIVAQDLRRR